MREQIDFQAAKLVAVLKKQPFSIDDFSKLLPDDEEAEGLTTDEGCNLYHVFFQQLVADPKTLRNLNQDTAAPIMSAMMEEGSVRASFFCEATKGNYKSQPLHYLVEAENINPAICVFNWLLENQYWALLSGGGVCYPPFMKLYFHKDFQFCLSFDKYGNLKFLAKDDAIDPIDAFDNLLQRGGESESLVPIEIILHLACFGWDQSSEIGSAVWNAVSYNIFRHRLNLYTTFIRLDSENLRTHFPRISDEHLPSFSALAAQLPKIVGDAPSMSVVVRDFLQAEWQMASPRAHNNLYLLVVGHLTIDMKDYENYISISPEYCDATYIFIYAYMLVYGNLEKAYNKFFGNFKDFVLCNAEKKIIGEETLLALLTRLVIAKKPYTPAVQQLCEILRNAAHRYGRRDLLEKIKTYQEPRNAILIRLELARQEKIVALEKQAALKNIKQALDTKDAKAARQALEKIKLNPAELEALLPLAMDCRSILIQLFNLLVDQIGLVPVINKMLRLHCDLMEDLLLEQDGFLIKNKTVDLDDKKIERVLGIYVDGFRFQERDGICYATFYTRKVRYFAPKINKKPEAPVPAAVPVLVVKPAEPMKAAEFVKAAEPATPLPKKEKREKCKVEKFLFLTGRQEKALAGIKQKFLGGLELPSSSLQAMIMFDGANLVELKQQATELQTLRDQARALLAKLQGLETEIRRELKLHGDQPLPLEHQPRTWAPDYVAELARLEPLLSEKSAAAEAELVRAKTVLQNLAFEEKLVAAEAEVLRIKALAGLFGSENHVERYNELDRCYRELGALTLQLSHLFQQFKRNLPKNLSDRFEALPKLGWTGFALFDAPAPAAPVKRLPFETQGFGCKP